MEYFKKILEYIKKLLGGQNKKKLIENSVIIIIIGIIAIIAGSTIFGKSSSPKSESLNQASTLEAVAGKTNDTLDMSDVEVKMGTILSQIVGAGKVSIMITYVSGNEKVPAYDTKKNENNTQEKDNTGGTRNSVQNSYENSVVYEEDQGGIKKPIIVKEVLPQVKGVIVVADGAGDPTVKEELSNAVGVLLDVPIFKIQVFERKTK